MANNFIGRWNTDMSSMSGLEEVMDAYGIQEQMKAVFRRSSPFVEFQIDGDTWTSTVGVGVEGMEPKVYKFKMGEEITAAGIDGAEVKSVTTFDNGVLTERAVQTGGKNAVAVTTREVSGDVMNVKTAVGSAALTCKMLKG